MYLESFSLEDIKCFERVSFEFPADSEGGRAGWYVLLGANATGKTTALQAMAVSLIGPGAWSQLHVPLGWARQGGGRGHGTLQATIQRGRNDGADAGVKGPLSPRIHVTPDESIELAGEPYDTPQFVLGRYQKSALLKSAYATKRKGWWVCGYGPFRRLSGGSAEATATLSQPRQFRVASLFRESVALTQCAPWLTQLHHRAHDGDNPNQKRDARTFDAACLIINSLLPGAVRLDRVDSTRVEFLIGGRRRVALGDLSDGYRSFLALVVDILRHLAEADDLSKRLDVVTAEGRKWTRVTAEGVVLIDEVDAHLHPSWQRAIGALLQRVFPRVQFIVSSHSPFIAQAATEGGIFVLKPDGAGDAVTALRHQGSVRGWRADAIFTSELFGLDDTVDLDSAALVREYRALSAKRSFGKPTRREQARLNDLEAALSRSLTAPGESLEEFKRRADTEAFIQRTLDSLDESA